MGSLLRRSASGVAAGLLFVVSPLLGEPQRKPEPQTYTWDFVGVSSASAAQSRSDSEGQPLRLALPGDERLPFELTLVSLDRNGYAIGDDAVFEVMLKHVGSTPIAVPWSRDMAAVSDAPRAQIVHVLLTFTDPVLGRQLIGFDNTLYGAETVPGTLLILHPGDSINIRAAARWFLSMGYAQAPERGWVRKLSVKAQFQLQGTKRFSSVADSANALRIELRERQ
jgi:hypothetical protein